ncbi:MAG: SpoIIE family protein phosphatase [Bacteroidales bacterium]
MKVEKTDSVKINILNALGKEYCWSANYILAISLSNEALDKALKINYTRGILEACINLFKSHHLNWVIGKKYADLAILKAENSKNKKYLAAVYREIAEYLSTSNQHHPENYAIKALEIYEELRDSVNIAETCYKLSEIYASWDKSLSIGEPLIALKYLDTCMAIYKKRGDVNGIMKTYTSYSNIYKLYFRDFKKTIEYTRKSEEEIERYLKTDPKNPDYLTRKHIVIFQWSTYYSEIEKDYAKAEKFLKLSISQALEIMKDFPMHPLNRGMLGSYYRHLGQLYLETGSINEADLYLKKYIYNEDTNNVAALCNTILDVEWIYRNNGQLTKAYDYLFKVFNLAEKSSNLWFEWQANYFLADLYQLMEEYEKGKNFYLECYDIGKKGNHLGAQIVSLNYVSNMYSKMLKTDSALYYCRKAEELNRNSLMDSILFVWIFHNYGGIYENAGNYPESLNYYLKALDIRETNRWNLTIETPYGFIASNSCIARVYLKLNNYEKAEVYVNKSLNSFLFNTYPEVERDDYLTLSKIYEHKNQPAKAFEFYKKHILLKDKILSDQNQRKIQLAEIESINKRKKAEIDQLNYKNQLNESKMQQQRALLYFFVIGLIMILILSVVIYRSYKIKSRANQLLVQSEQKLLEKNKLLVQLNDEVHAQNEEITLQRNILARQNTKITDSIIYASLIQQALLPSVSVLEQNFKDNFIYFKPRDIVGGDFYWFKQIGHFVYIAVADGTGHGVPGAFMSTLGTSILNEILGKDEIRPPDAVLDQAREKLLHNMKQDGSGNGLDIALCLIDTKNFKLDYAGANIPLYIFRGNEYEIIKPDKMPIGHYPKAFEKYRLNTVQLEKGNSIYIATDGIGSQLGGNANLKFSSAKFLKIISASYSRPMHEQMANLAESLKNWQNGQEQVDDILVLGIRI